jgi:integrase
MNYQTLAELHARAIVHGDALKLWQRHAVGKAVTRLLQHAADSSTQPATAADILAWHQKVSKPLARKIVADEAAMLRRLLHLPSLPAAVADRIVRGTATMDDALVALDHRRDLAEQRGQLRGAVERFAAKVTSLPTGGTGQIPARVHAVSAQLEKLSHADFRMADSSWPAFCSRVRRVAAIVDCTFGRSIKRSQLSGPWAALVADIDEHADTDKPRDKRTKHEPTAAGHLAKLWPLIALCERNGIAPEAVCDETIELLLADRAAAQLAAPFETARNAVYAWEALQQLVPGFPAQRLARLYSNGKGFGLPFERLPQSLQDDWKRFVQQNAAAPVDDLVKLVVDDGNGRPQLGSVRRVGATIKPERLVNFKSTIVAAANAVIAAGLTPRTLMDLATPSVARRTLEDALLRQRAKNPATPPKNSYLKALAGNLLKIGRLIGTPASDEQGLVALRDDVDPYLIEIRVNGQGKERRIFDLERMGQRHAKRLEQFNDPAKLHAWFQMMPTLFRRMQDIVREEREPTSEEVNDSIACVLHAITQSCPIRRSNLAKITVFGSDPWLRLPAFEDDRARLQIPAQFVKNRKQVDGELTPEAAEIVRLFVQHFRPAMAKAVGASDRNPYLFPGRGMVHRSGTQLNNIFVDRNWRIGGFDLNIHCQRHVCGKLILDEDPTQMALVQILLDHKSIATTASFYAKINKIIALRQFHSLVAKRRQELLDLMAEQKRYSRPRGKGRGRTGK